MRLALTVIETQTSSSLSLRSIYNRGRTGCSDSEIIKIVAKLAPLGDSSSRRSSSGALARWTCCWHKTGRNLHSLTPSSSSSLSLHCTHCTSSDPKSCSTSFTRSHFTASSNNPSGSTLCCTHSHWLMGDVTRSAAAGGNRTYPHAGAKHTTPPHKKLVQLYFQTSVRRATDGAEGSRAAPERRRKEPKTSPAPRSAAWSASAAHRVRERELVAD